MAEVPTSTNKITKEWLTEVLRASGRLTSEVSAIELEPIGEGVGLMGELGRLHITYTGDESLPATMIAKCAAQNENRQVAQVLDFYNREANFYNRLANDCPMHVPGSYHADVKQDTYDFVLLMEDLGDVSPRDQLIGASVEEAESAIDGLASMHARWWGVSTESDPWMYDMHGVEEAGRLKELVYVPALEGALGNFGYLISDEMSKVIRTVGENFESYWALNLSAHESFLHGDYRQDNMLYPEDATDAIVMDWQISGRGKPAFDLAYFMCQSLPEDVRKREERNLVLRYVEKLASHGVEYTFDEAWEDYRRLILGCLVYPVTVCGTLDTANERGKALGECMMSRNLAAIQDLACDDLLV